MLLREAALQRDSNLRDAIQTLEIHPDFSRVQLRIRDRLRESEKDGSSESRGYGNKARLEYVLRRLDIRAESFLELVSDTQFQNAFVVVLDSLVRVAWEEYAGAPPEMIRPRSAQALANLDLIQARIQPWISEGYKRLELLRKVQPGSEDRGERSDGPRAVLPSQVSILASGGGVHCEQHAGSAVTLSHKPGVVSAATSQKDNRSSHTTLQATTWHEIEICFLSDFQVEIRIGQNFEVCNYAELGLEDRRSHKPNAVWQLFRALAESEGSLLHSGKAGRNWTVIEKRVQRLREFLRHYFHLPGDPLPFSKGHGYRSRFSIGCRPSFHA
jgi:hypothetical protein